MILLKEKRKIYHLKINNLNKKIKTQNLINFLFINIPIPYLFY